MTREVKEEKIAKVLRTRSLNRFEAEELGDHCLPSTISSLEKKGYEIERIREKVNTKFGRKASVNRYWITSRPKHWQPESNN